MPFPLTGWGRAAKEYSALPSPERSGQRRDAVSPRLIGSEHGVALVGEELARHKEAQAAQAAEAAAVRSQIY
eukprot:4647682-Pyramimonas_sp.AAC.1